MRSIRARLLPLILPACVIAPATIATAQTVDLVVRNARVVDGTGSPWFVSDVAIDDGRIASIRRALDVDADRTIDAGGRVLAPGFIDVHTHVESSANRDGIDRIPRADNFLLDGVTTIVTGNCGGSEIDIGAWSRSLEGLGINVATLIGHNSVRREIMGLDDRAPSGTELEQMHALVERAMRDGAVGFSTGLLYVPGTYADTEEVISLAKVASGLGGVYASHMREQGAALHDSIDEAVRIGREAGMPVQISHFKVKGATRWGSIGDAIALIEAHRRDGVDVVIDAYPYERASTNLGVNLPRWAVAGEVSDIAERIEDPQTRDQIEAGMKAMLADQGFPDYSFAMVSQYPPDPGLNGKTISEVNRLKGRPATVDGEIDTILDMMLEGGSAGYAQGASMIYHYMSMDDVDTIFRYPNAAVASDGGVREPGPSVTHPRSYGTNARVLGEFVRERQLLTLEDAIRRMTSLPARTFGFHDRGILRPGMVADLVLVDPDRVADRATFDAPHQYSEGIDFVFVNGVAVVYDGKLTDARPGRFVKGPAADTD